LIEDEQVHTILFTSANKLQQLVLYYKVVVHWNGLRLYRAITTRYKCFPQETGLATHQICTVNHRYNQCSINHKYNHYKLTTTAWTQQCTMLNFHRYPQTRQLHTTYNYRKPTSRPSNQTQPTYTAYLPPKQNLSSTQPKLTPHNTDYVWTSEDNFDLSDKETFTETRIANNTSQKEKNKAPNVSWIGSADQNQQQIRVSQWPTLRRKSIDRTTHSDGFDSHKMRTQTTANIHLRCEQL